MARPFDLDGRIKKALNNAIKEVAQECHDELINEFDHAINDFYEDYPNPSAYNRNYLAYMASEGYTKKEPQKTSDGWIAGISIDFSFIEDFVGSHPYKEFKFSSPEIFERTYKGIHGFTPNEARKMHLVGEMPPKIPYNNSPKGRMNNKYVKMTKRNRYIDQKIEKAIDANLNKYLG